MKIRIYGGRVGFGTEWEDEFEVDSDTTEKEIDYLAGEMSGDFMEYTLEDHADMYDYWYEWEILEGEWNYGVDELT
jgi:hypothetical protein